MKEFVVNGNNFDNLEGFYCEIDRLLTKNLSFETGHNYESFNDLLKFVDCFIYFNSFLVKM